MEEALLKGEVIAAIERRGPSRVPLHFMHYYNEETAEKYADGIARLHEEYPEDVIKVQYPNPDWDSLAAAPINMASAIDKRVSIPDYDSIEKVCAKIRSFGHYLDMTVPTRMRAENPDRYCLGYTWFGIFERVWMLRGMENVLSDFYIQPDNIRMLIEAVADFHAAAIRKYGELGCDGIAISDDLGGRKSTMFGRDIFREFYKPLYTRMFACAHSYGMHVWMHSCGHVIPFIEDLIETGLDVLHPIQHSLFSGGYSANDPYEVVRRFGGRLSFWAGIDVQYLLPRGTPDQVRTRVRRLIDIFDGDNGGMIIAAGNGIMPETPFENILAFFDEAVHYGKKKRQMIGTVA